MIIIKVHTNAVLSLHFCSINPARPQDTVRAHCGGCWSVPMFHKIIPGMAIAVDDALLNPRMQTEPMTAFAPLFNQARVG